MEDPDWEGALAQRVYEALGAASMCWDESPLGIFDSDRAIAVGDELLRYIRDEYIPSRGFRTQGSN